MNIVSLSNAPKVPINIEGYKIQSSASLEVIHLCLQQDQDIPQHTNPFDVVVILIKGLVTLNTGENRIQLALYDTVEIEKELNRGFINCGTEEARLVIIKKL